MNIYQARNLQKKRCATFFSHFKRMTTFLINGKLHYGILFRLGDEPYVGINSGTEIQNILDMGIRVSIEYHLKCNPYYGNSVNVPDGIYVFESIPVD